ncbi:hypothetical protein E5676_scaffold142G001560 [Cucumis melo var. makuwa]|uniref:Uncharacterized protein n=1 Tax=Cucumis melo var. makuwa TaxID=1194695 RepID=A0A5D3DHL4_CUCMM|nr:hypothetical protein E5676_scaffold142G001560 [Cucumis melo var. makuwa]
MPTRHDNIISLNKIMLLYYIMEEILVNVGEIIYKHILAWDLFQDSICDPLTFIDDAFRASEDTTRTPIVSPSKEALKKVVDNPFLKGKQIASEEAGETHLP